MEQTKIVKITTENIGRVLQFLILLRFDARMSKNTIVVRPRVIGQAAESYSAGDYVYRSRTAKLCGIFHAKELIDFENATLCEITKSGDWVRIVNAPDPKESLAAEEASLSDCDKDFLDPKLPERLDAMDPKESLEAEEATREILNQTASRFRSRRLELNNDEKEQLDKERILEINANPSEQEVMDAVTNKEPFSDWFKDLRDQDAADKAKLRTLTIECAKSHKKAKKWKKAYKLAQSDINKFRDDLDEAKAQELSRMREIERLTEANAGAAKALIVMQETLKTMGQTSSTGDESLKTKDRLIAKLETMLRESTQRAEAWKKNFEDLRDDKAELARVRAEDFKELRNEKAELEHTLGVKESWIESLNGTVKLFQTKIAEQDKEIETLNKLIDHTTPEFELTELEKLWREGSQRVDAWAKDLVERLNQNPDASDAQQIQNLMYHCSELNAKIDHLKTKLKRAGRLYNKVRHMLKRTREDHVLLDRNYKQMQVHYRHAQDYVDTHETQEYRFKKELDAANTNISRIAEANTGLAEALAERNAEIESLNAHVHDLQATIDLKNNILTPLLAFVAKAQNL